MTPRDRAIAHATLAYGGNPPPGGIEQIALEAYELIARHVVEVAHIRRQGAVGLHFENPELLPNAFAFGRGGASSVPTRAVSCAWPSSRTYWV